jgi:hypothetical protein
VKWTIKVVKLDPKRCVLNTHSKPMKYVYLFRTRKDSINQRGDQEAVNLRTTDNTIDKKANNAPHNTTQKQCKD